MAAVEGAEVEAAVAAALEAAVEAAGLAMDSDLEKDRSMAGYHPCTRRELPASNFQR